MIIVLVSFYCILLRSCWSGGGNAQCRVTSFTMFSSLRGQHLVSSSLPPSLLAPLLIDNNKGRPFCIPAPACPMIVTKSRVIVSVWGVWIIMKTFCAWFCCVSTELWVRPWLAQPFPMNGSVTGRGAAVNIDMQYQFKPNHYLCIVILELSSGWGRLLDSWHDVSW